MDQLILMMQVTTKDWRPLAVAGAALVLLFVTVFFKYDLFGSWITADEITRTIALWGALGAALILGLMAQSRPHLLRWAYWALGAGVGILFLILAFV